jgi:hypothetical protein
MGILRFIGILFCIVLGGAGGGLAVMLTPPTIGRESSKEVCIDKFGGRLIYLFVTELSGEVGQKEPKQGTFSFDRECVSPNRALYEICISDKIKGGLGGPRICDQYRRGN